MLLVFTHAARQDIFFLPFIIISTPENRKPMLYDEPFSGVLALKVIAFSAMAHFIKSKSTVFAYAGHGAFSGQ